MTVKTDVITSLNPADESIIEEVPVTPEKRVLEILESASGAQVDWAKRPLSERIELMGDAADTLDDRTEEIAKTMTEEQGKPLSEALGEVSNTVDRIRYFCEKVEALVHPDVVPVNENVTGVINHRPHGVVVGIKPWNFPVSIPIWTIVPALLTGNSVVFKPSELTPVVGRQLIECFPDELHKSNILNLVQGSGETGRLLVESEHVNSIAFVGSRETGEWIYKASAPHIRPVSLELGGKDPMVVLEDADEDRAFDGVMYGAFKNCGQVCCGIERLLIPEAVAESFVDRLTEAVRELVVGDGFDEESDLGPMIRQTEVDRVKEHLRDAEDKGATIIRSKNIPDTEHGFWQAPALVTDVTDDMKIMNEETFGPVLPVMSYEDEKDAIAEANRLEYGLGASIFSEDPEHARNVADQVEAGSIGINQTVGSIVNLPWGGVKKSGIGRMLNEEGVLKFTESVTERWHPEELEELE